MAARRHPTSPRRCRSGIGRTKRRHRTRRPIRRCCSSAPAESSNGGGGGGRHKRNLQADTIRSACHASIECDQTSQFGGCWLPVGPAQICACQRLHHAVINALLPTTATATAVHVRSRGLDAGREAEAQLIAGYNNACLLCRLPKEGSNLPPNTVLYMYFVGNIYT